MKLFENEIINIAKIHTIAKYDYRDSFIPGITHSYNVNLPTYELVFFLEGSCLTEFNKKQINDSENSVRYMPKGITDGEYHTKPQKPTVCIDIYFDTNDPMPDTALGFKNLPVLKSQFIKLHNIWQAKKNGYYSEAMSILYAIIAEIKRSNRDYISNASREKIEASYNYMVSHCGKQNFDYKKMCAASGLSYDYFKELFKKAYGMPPVKYVTSLRIERAKELLITGRYQISEIAEKCGFENVYYFSTVFKKETGLPPSRYRS